MLKIKDEVDLKELEKFGFKSFIDNNKREYYFNNHGIQINGDVVARKNICKRKILNPHYLGHDKLLFDVVYDLIQAGLVEKI